MRFAAVLGAGLCVAWFAYVRDDHTQAKLTDSERLYIESDDHLRHKSTTNVSRRLVLLANRRSLAAKNAVAATFLIARCLVDRRLLVRTKFYVNRRSPRCAEACESESGNSKLARAAGMWRPSSICRFIIKRFTGLASTRCRRANGGV